MTLKEIRTIVDNIALDENKQVRIKINYPNYYWFSVMDITSFEILNGDIVFNIDVGFLPRD